MSNEQNNSTVSESSDPVDEIANLFVGEQEEQSDPTDSYDESETTIEDDHEEEEDYEDSEEDSEESNEPSEEYDLSDVAEVLGLDVKDVDVDEDGNLMFTTKVDGKISKVSLTDLKKGYQMESSYTQRSQTLAEERKSFEAQREQVADKLAKQIHQTEGLMVMLQQELMGDYQKINWEELRALDPAEYTAKRYDFEQRQQQLNQAAQYADQVQQKRTEELSQVSEESLQQQWVKMIENNPQWDDEEVYTRDMKSMRDFASNQYGFTDEDFAMVRDARVIELIKDAKAYRDGAKVVAEVNTKKVKRNAPKLQRAANGQFVSKKASKLDKLVTAAKKAKGGNKRDLEAAAISQLLLGGK